MSKGSDNRTALAAVIAIIVTIGFLASTCGKRDACKQQGGTPRGLECIQEDKP